MRQRPNFGPASATNEIAATAIANSRLNLESTFDGEREEGAGDGGGGGGGGGGGSLSARAGARKPGVKPPSSLSVDVGKSRTPRGDRCVFLSSEYRILFIL